MGAEPRTACTCGQRGASRHKDDCAALIESRLRFARNIDDYIVAPRLAVYKAELAEKVRGLRVGLAEYDAALDGVLALLEAEPPQIAQEGIALPPDGDSDWRQDELPGSY